ncbi:alpha/beta hydrolase [Nocardioides marmoriginsengisoli]|uniref:Alpha/beta hydrolase n=1 Tax=Nocardioides marmoriginsengisoli TaxID=661483 RepID=A0A3N0CCC0_9ACTN|nr:alpha/beta hydrolase [Nocardioides marmoriginsengisoli]RNL61092.1 alpha/beta hydrolase [Nocardioides marmoriginsengisoli]
MTSLLRTGLAWAAVAAAARSARPAQVLGKPFTGPVEALPVVPTEVVGLLASELPLHTAGLVAATTASALLRGGPPRSVADRLGAGLAVAGGVALLGAQRQQQASGRVLEEALRAGLGEHYRDHLPADGRAPDRVPLTRRQVLLPRFTERAGYLRAQDLSYGDAGRRNHLDIWSRTDLPVDGRAPVLIQVHGSAWVAGSKRGQGYPLMSLLARRGWVCVAINYRLAPAARWPAHIIDVKRAIAWVKQEIAAYGGDPEFVAITGGSAGGHLSALAALSANAPVFQPGFEEADTSVVAGVPLYGVYDLIDRHGDSPKSQEEFWRRLVLGQSRDEAFAIYDQGSPLSWIGPDAPPLFVLHGAEDTFTAPAQAGTFASSLRAVSRQPVVHAELPGTHHCWDLLPSLRTAYTVHAIDRFLAYVRATRREGEHR